MFDNLFAGFPKLIFVLLLGFVTFLFGHILKPFFFAIFWAILLAAIFSPLYKWLQLRFKSPNLCAGLSLAAVLITLILPAGFILALLVGETFDLYQSIHSSGGSWMNSINGVFNSLSNHPLLARFNIDQQFITDKTVDVLKVAANFFVKNLSALTGNTIVFFVEFAVMLYCLFYFLRDGKKLIDTFTHYMPVDEQHMNTFISEFLVTSKATLKFTFIIGGIQGLLGGLIFYITGVDRALVWGVLMVGLSIVPAIGNSIIWAPAGIIMLLLGHIWQGIAILLFGAVVISSVDNLLRPILLGQDIQMHSLLIFLSTLGGIAAFGFSGFVLGPVVAAFFLASWKMFLELSSQGNVSEKTGLDP
jgi:predicted PurR-regulated permease PerM